ncbi:Pyrimidine-nucleoside phosphorylase [Rubripirellula amarantea]|uniref:thymidine phosphorylase n=1 Tax=Rubripirellula amarantea TaxID=2527999 RepID=A0A5C5WTS1_9BACT|nr:thymidine phosphorylase [Rubripirellula amarantea]TWT54087.1 Pyrimidine-nucleoside phosphorylase [Rubripirellula amarantea]
MLASTLIVKKREGGELSDSEIRFLIDGFCEGNVADYQMSALAMAICLRGMTEREITTLTMAMLESGERLPRTDRGKPRVDKHSTGGLGDKVSLILAPLLAVCDVDVPMVSGRGLGLTGGTLDKLEAIEGFRTDFSSEEATQLLDQVGAFIISASDKIAPADRRLYALRDVTGTVESIALITASILSKKLSASLDALVMDVKCGSGAFMPTLEQAEKLSRSIVSVGVAAGMPTQAMITDMDQPLGETIGNAIEVNESLEVLQGKPGVVRDLTVALCANLLVQVGTEATSESANARLERALDDGSAMERFEALVHAQSGKLAGPLPLAKPHVINAKRAGFVERVDCPAIGEAVVAMGGGRRMKGDQLNHQVGIRTHCRVGAKVEQGDPLLTVYCDSAADYAELLAEAVVVVDQPVSERPLIVKRFQ